MKKCNAKGENYDYIYIELNVDIDRPRLYPLFDLYGGHSSLISIVKNDISSI
jgi:hypothetical protein